MNYVRLFFLSFFLFCQIFPCRIKIAAGILSFPQKQESQYPSLMDLIKPTRQPPPYTLHEQSHRGRNGTRVVGEKTAVMATSLSQSEAIVHAPRVGEKSLHQVLNELKAQSQSNATVNELLSVYELTLQQVKNVQLTQAQIAYFKSFTPEQWQAFIQQVFGLQSLNSISWNDIFDMYTFYQFPAFREFVKTLPEYNQSLVLFSQKLDPSSTKYDKTLAEKVENTEVGVGIFESMRDNQEFNEKIQLQAKYFAESIAAFTTQEQYAAIKRKKAELSTIDISYKQRNCKKECNDAKEPKNDLKKRYENLKDEYLLKIRNLEIEIATKQANQKRKEFENQVREKKCVELQQMEVALETDVKQTRKEFKQAEEKYANELKKYKQLTNQKERSKFEREVLRKIILEECIPLATKSAEITEKIEQVRAKIYMHQWAEGLLNQNRLKAFNGENNQKVQLNKNAQQLFKDSGFNFNKYHEAIYSKIGNQMRSEGIELLNRVANMSLNGLLTDSQSKIIRSTIKLADAILSSSYKHDVYLAWATSDLANAMLDLTVDGNTIKKNQHPEYKPGPVEQGILQAAERLAHPQKIAADTLISAIILMDALGRAETAEDTRSNTQSLQEKLKKQEAVCKAFDEISKAMNNMTRDDVIRELVAAGIEGYSIGKIAKAAKIFTKVSGERLLGLSFDEVSKARIINSMQVTENASELLNQNRAIKAQALAQSIEVEGVEVFEGSTGRIESNVRNNNISAFSEMFDSTWDMPEQGKMINGRFYTRHALERMAPKTSEVVKELERRAIEKGHLPGSKEYKSYIDPRGIPPIVIEDAINNGQCTSGTYPWTWNYETDSVRVIVNEYGDVITVHCN